MAEDHTNHEPPKVTLQVLVDQLNELMQMEGYLDQQTYSDTLEGVEGAFEVKAEKVVYALAGLEKRAGLMRDQVRRFRERIASVEKNADYLRNYLLHALIATNKTRVETPSFTIARRKTESVHITEEEDLPSQLMRVKKEPDKVAIKKQLKAGEHVPGAELRIGQSLTITGTQDHGEPE